MSDLTKADVLILLDMCKEKEKQFSEANDKIKKAGWSGNGVVGFALERTQNIKVKLETLYGELVTGA